MDASSPAAAFMAMEAVVGFTFLHPARAIYSRAVPCVESFMARAARHLERIR